jgi:hypothetical protein
MLHDGETSKEQAEMLEMDTSDHDAAKGADVPVPVDAEAEVTCEPMCKKHSCQVVASRWGLPSEACRDCPGVMLGVDGDNADGGCFRGAEDFDLQPAEGPEHT